MSTITEIIAVNTHRNGVSGLPFLTAIVDMDLGNHVRRLSISFAYKTNDQGEMSGHEVDEQGQAICFVLDLEGMFEGDLNQQYRGGNMAHRHAEELIAEYQRLAVIRCGG